MKLLDEDKEEYYCEECGDPINKYEYDYQDGLCTFCYEEKEEEEHKFILNYDEDL